MEAVVALFILLFGFAASEQVADEEIEMEETMEEMVMEEESMGKM